MLPDSRDRPEQLGLPGSEVARHVTSISNCCESYWVGQVRTDYGQKSPIA